MHFSFFFLSLSIAKAPLVQSHLSFVLSFCFIFNSIPFCIKRQKVLLFTFRPSTSAARASLFEFQLNCSFPFPFIDVASIFIIPHRPKKGKRSKCAPTHVNQFARFLHRHRQTQVFFFLLSCTLIRCCFVTLNTNSK